MFYVFFCYSDSYTVLPRLKSTTHCRKEKAYKKLDLPLHQGELQNKIQFQCHPNYWSVIHHSIHSNGLTQAEQELALASDDDSHIINAW